MAIGIPNFISSPWQWAKAPVEGMKIGSYSVGNGVNNAANGFSSFVNTKGSSLASKISNPGLANKFTALKTGIATRGAGFISSLNQVPRGIPVLVAGLETIKQVPQVFEGFKQGRGGAQLGNSAIDVASVTAGAWGGFAAGAKAGALATSWTANPLIIGAGTIIGGLGGAFLGTSVGKKVGNVAGKFFFGENKEKTSPQNAYTQQAMFPGYTMPQGMPQQALAAPAQGHGAPQLTQADMMLMQVLTSTDPLMADDNPFEKSMPGTGQYGMAQQPYQYQYQY